MCVGRGLLEVRGECECCEGEEDTLELLLVGGLREMQLRC